MLALLANLTRMYTKKTQGRPRIEPDAKRATITLTISAGLRASLEAEAAKADASLSQIANGWLERGRLVAAAERALLKFAEV